jgi:hypothetical protein
MTEALGVWAQANPLATTLTDLYTVPVDTEFAGHIKGCNRGGSAITFRIAVAPEGAADALEQYLAYDEPLDANRSFGIAQLALAAGTVVRVYASAATFSVSLTGVLRT